MADNTEVQNLQEFVENHLNERKYTILEKELVSRLEELDEREEVDLLVFAELAGAFVSLGSESNNKKAVETGLRLFLDNEEVLEEGGITKDSFYYCLGNAYSALYKISISNMTEWYITPELIKGHLFDAKQYYFKAFKNIDLHNLDKFSVQILSNLAGNLTQSGRIVEALQLVDMVLKFNPNFPQALVHKVDILVMMTEAFKWGPTKSMFAEILNLTVQFLEENSSPPAYIQTRVEEINTRTKQILESIDFDLSTMESEFELNKKEYQSHPEELKFYLDNFLTLSEHSLYCKCNSVRLDKLFIGFEGYVFNDRKIARLEHVLNRIKSEFSFARKQLFEYIHYESLDFTEYQNFGRHSLQYGVDTEKLRISFRMCFGILDKIALGLLHLYDLELGKNENVYFDRFWNGNRAPKGRWGKLNKFKNIHLTALYSMACDLNKENGEFHYYKKWRNLLEHDMLSIIPMISSGENLDIFDSSVLKDNCREDEFKENSLHLLQMVRAAIFSFAFCCREELLKDENPQ